MLTLIFVIICNLDFCHILPKQTVGLRPVNVRLSGWKLRAIFLSKMFGSKAQWVEA